MSKSAPEIFALLETASDMEVIAFAKGAVKRGWPRFKGFEMKAKNCGGFRAAIADYFEKGDKDAEVFVQHIAVRQMTKRYGITDEEVSRGVFTEQQERFSLEDRRLMALITHSELTPPPESADQVAQEILGWQDRILVLIENLVGEVHETRKGLMHLESQVKHIQDQVARSQEEIAGALETASNLREIPAQMTNRIAAVRREVNMLKMRLSALEGGEEEIL